MYPLAMTNAFTVFFLFFAFPSSVLIIILHDTPLLS